MNSGVLMVMMSLAVFLPAAAETLQEVCATSGGWFAIDTRAVKTSTLLDGEEDILGGETEIALMNSANAWGEKGGGRSSTVVWRSTSGRSGTIDPAISDGAFAWKPEKEIGVNTNTLTYTSGSVVKKASFLVISPYFQLVFDPGTGTGEMNPLLVAPDQVVNLPACRFSAPSGRTFAGWQGSDERRYDDRVLVFSDQKMRTLVLTALWK